MFKNLFKKHKSKQEVETKLNRTIFMKNKIS